MRNSQVGDLLVATTEVDGTVLNRGVCLLVYEDEESAVGVMLNRPMRLFQSPQNQELPGEIQLPNSNPTNRLSQFETPAEADAVDFSGDEAADDAPDSVSSPNSPAEHAVAFTGPSGDPEAGEILAGKSLYFGGPLSGPVVAVHGAEHLAEAEAGEGIFVAAQRDYLEALLQAEQPVPYRLIVGHLGWSQYQLSNEIEDGVWHRIRATNDILSTADEWLWPKLIRAATAGSVSRWLGTEHVADAHLLN
ncbi:YqgE/AlgH family protein [Allorhodopirellula solitaria]|uniref:Uncharacterized protein n=1 Tax=Allorhodopirellula solitaria TaxID=2527987 RepID=A0A5C5YJT3_9BACT|nr:YqgE/AlgH family protein [Allorhodopirellula solitaria]TWT75154.1 hypothetical protein CA85_04430 [Allorhodopirellula solitaria]